MRHSNINLLLFGFIAVFLLFQLQAQPIPLNDPSAPLKLPYDEQGNRVVSIIKTEFTLPLDKRSMLPAIYSTGWAYKENDKWMVGSHIFIHGISTQELQKKLFDRIQALVTANRYLQVKVSFCEEARYEYDESGSKRLPFKTLKTEIAK